MQKLNDSVSAPLRFITENGETWGKFYNSRDGLYHLAEYTPFRKPPSIYLCGREGNFSASRRDDDRNLCPVCFAKVQKAGA